LCAAGQKVLQVRQYVEGVGEGVARRLLRALLMHGCTRCGGRRLVLLLVACLWHHGPKAAPYTGTSSGRLLLLLLRRAHKIIA
jgi:hypothetical protein